MSKSYLTLLGLSLVLTWTSCQKDIQETEDANTDGLLQKTLADAAPGNKGSEHFRLPDEGEFFRIPQDPGNPLNAYKIALGKLLFHETALGLNPRMKDQGQTFSCASCHHADAGFQAGIAQGIGEGGWGFGRHGEMRLLNPACPIDSADVQAIRSPSALNVAFQELMLWNGQFGATGQNKGTDSRWTAGTPKETNKLGYMGVETQAIAGQNVHRMKADPNMLKAYPEYQRLFDRAFPELPAAQRISRVTVGLAIAAYERTLLANQAPFQKWLRGSATAMTEQQKIGAVLFFGKAGCANCHNGPALNSMEFHAYGMDNLENGKYGAIQVSENKPEHLGRGGFTGNPDDNYKFKVPQLYNLKQAHFLGHGSSFQSVRQVVEYKNNGVAQNRKVPASQLSAQFKPLGLSASEVEALTDFIENALYDPSLDRYVPKTLPSGMCFPNNDMASRRDKGCN